MLTLPPLYKSHPICGNVISYIENLLIAFHYSSRTYRSLFGNYKYNVYLSVRLTLLTKIKLEMSERGITSGLFVDHYSLGPKSMARFKSNLRPFMVPRMSELVIQCVS